MNELLSEQGLSRTQTPPPPRTVVGRTRNLLARLGLVKPARAKGTSIGEPAFPGSANYWEQRYASGGNSGKGSYGKHAKFKARVINEFVRKHAIGSVIEFGAGDGNQLMMLKIPRYVGLDVSSTAIKSLKQIFATDKSKEFWLSESGVPTAVSNDSFDLTMSLDVIYHLIEDDVFEQYMRDLFETSSQFVMIYASDNDENACSHVKHRCFTKFVEREITDWKLFKKIENPNKPKSPSDFFIYKKIGNKP